ncbi:MAG: DUF3164 family protein [Candidatus Auribacterota bacterium]|jgi:hypothetical protein|nr:DUF3164 family protein [Candidatus Auribacterota bacterium]
MQEIDVNKLSPEQQEALLSQLQERQKEEKRRQREEREEYRKTVDETIPELFIRLNYASEVLANIKKLVFDDTAHLIDLKNSIYGVKDSQQSHTFTTTNGFSITIGYRVIDGWDDTVSAGVELVKNYLATLAKDENSSKLVETIMSLLKKDAKGNLKANRVIELQKLAATTDNDDFQKGMNIIMEAYKPKRSATFVEASWRDDKGKDHSLPLSISAVEMDAEKPDFLKQKVVE